MPAVLILIFVSEVSTSKGPVKKQIEMFYPIQSFATQISTYQN